MFKVEKASDVICGPFGMNAKCLISVEQMHLILIPF